MAADHLDDPDYPAYTTGRAAELLGVQQAFLRTLDDVGAVSPVRSAGKHRRYTRRQLAFAQRVREQFDQGHNLAATLRILALEDDLAAERARADGLCRELSEERARASQAAAEPVSPAVPGTASSGRQPPGPGAGPG